jgi:hypothetical protein
MSKIYGVAGSRGRATNSSQPAFPSQGEDVGPHGVRGRLPRRGTGSLPTETGSINSVGGKKTHTAGINAVRVSNVYSVDEKSFCRHRQAPDVA